MTSLIGCIVLFSVFLITNGENGFIPSYIKPCTLGNDLERCVKQQIEASLPYFTRGIPELDVPSLDPVHLNDIKIDGNGLKLTFTEAAMHGISKSYLTDFKLNLKEEQFTLAFKGNMSLTAKYEVDGRILILPIQGKGDAVVKARNIEVIIHSNLTHVTDNNGEHFKLVLPNYSYDIQNTKFVFDNLFNGNKQLSDATHQFANDNWRQLMDDLAPPAVQQIVRTCVKAINKFFSKVTIQQIVLGYKD